VTSLTFRNVDLCQDEGLNGSFPFKAEGFFKALGVRWDHGKGLNEGFSFKNEGFQKVWGFKGAG